MKIEKLESFYIVNSIKEHITIKPELLNLIDKIPITEFKTSEENIVHTDWNLPKDYKREYADYFFQCIKPYMIEMSNKLHNNRCEIYNVWFQQYSKNNRHDWHVHQQANYTNVYYLEMPDNNMRTELYNILDDSIITLDVKEGDMVTFPAHLLHRSKLNESGNRKSIISFNCDFYEVTLK